MIKLVIFDLDGVLIDAKQIHYECLNEVLPEQYKIHWHEHLQKYDGLKTKEKLFLLSKEKGLPINLHEQIWQGKQKNTLDKLSSIKPNIKLCLLIEELVKNNYHIAVCSNSIRKTILTVLHKLNIVQHIDLILSNEDVNKSKPHPEIYWKAISYFGLLPQETLIIEDSPHGLLAAQRSGSNTYRVKNSQDLINQNILSIIYKYNLNSKEKIMWQDPSLSVLIPMAGAGSRFEQAGYSFPKPLIDVRGRPMIQVVTDNLSFDSPHIFIVQQQHRDKYNLDNLLPLIIKNKTSIIDIEGVTEGAACTTLLAKDLINNDHPLIIANSDQYVNWNSSEFMYKMQEQNVDAGILTFKSTHPKWSFVKIDNDGFVTEVAEKNPISNIATVGIYYWKKGSDYVKYAEQMIKQNKRFNNEFYVCPVFNEAIADGKKIITYDIKDMWGLGTPEDLQYFLNNYDTNFSSR
jgi:HAD superfamily hydrolase (TIGR01509 family)